MGGSSFHGSNNQGGQTKGGLFCPPNTFFSKGGEGGVRGVFCFLGWGFLAQKTPHPPNPKRFFVGVIWVGFCVFLKKMSLCFLVLFWWGVGKIPVFFYFFTWKRGWGFQKKSHSPLGCSPLLVFFQKNTKGGGFRLTFSSVFKYFPKHTKIVWGVGFFDGSL